MAREERNSPRRSRRAAPPARARSQGSIRFTAFHTETAENRVLSWIVYHEYDREEKAGGTEMKTPEKVIAFSGAGMRSGAQPVENLLLVDQKCRVQIEIKALVPGLGNLQFMADFPGTA